MEVFHSRRTANTIGLVLAFHGVVAFGEDARSAYEHMIELVTRAEEYLQTHGAWNDAPVTQSTVAPDAEALRKVHAAINAVAGAPLAMHVISDAQSIAFMQRADLAEISQQGPATPQHAVYTKRVPMIGRAVGDYAARYREYLDTHLGKAASAMIDAAPRIVLDPAFGLCAFGKASRDAEAAAEMFRHDMTIITRASAHGRYRSAPLAAIAQAEFEYGGYAVKMRPKNR
jgi:rhamnose utilization protein RhaD (predicted bifunctional aldolase and dehydrogenase)